MPLGLALISLLPEPILSIDSLCWECLPYQTWLNEFFNLHYLEIARKGLKKIVSIPVEKSVHILVPLDYQVIYNESLKPWHGVQESS